MLRSKDSGSFRSIHYFKTGIAPNSAYFTVYAKSFELLQDMSDRLKFPAGENKNLQDRKKFNCSLGQPKKQFWFAVY